MSPGAGRAGRPGSRGAGVVVVVVVVGARLLITVLIVSRSKGNCGAAGGQIADIMQCRFVMDPIIYNSWVIRAR